MKSAPNECEQRNDSLDDLAAQLTDAAYQVALRYGIGNRWWDLQRELWMVFCHILEYRGGSQMIETSNALRRQMTTNGTAPCLSPEPKIQHHKADVDLDAGCV